jgi:hypothetical protein
MSLFTKSWQRCGSLALASAALVVACKNEQTREATNDADRAALATPDGAPAPAAAALDTPGATASVARDATDPSGSPGAAGAGYDPCHDLCGRSRELGCPNASRCPDTCREMLAGATCSDALRIALRCFAAQPVSRWECGEEGIANVREGTCDAEQARYARCIASAAGP